MMCDRFAKGTCKFPEATAKDYDTAKAERTILHDNIQHAVDAFKLQKT